VRALGGVKSLYSESYYDEATFWQLYDGEEYFRLKRKYDPNGRLRDLYQKCVRRE
jgi:FAD/FMN-containing dehydrogenase